MARKRDPRYGHNLEDWIIRVRKDLLLSIGKTNALRLVIAAEESLVAARALSQKAAEIARLVDGSRLSKQVILGDAVFLVTKMTDVMAGLNAIEQSRLVVRDCNVMGKKLVAGTNSNLNVALLGHSTDASTSSLDNAASCMTLAVDIFRRNHHSLKQLIDLIGTQATNRVIWKSKFTAQRADGYGVQRKNKSES